MRQDKGTGNKPRPEKEAERAPKKMTKPGGGGKPQAVDENSRYTSTGNGKPLGMKKDNRLTECSSSEGRTKPEATDFDRLKTKHHLRHVQEMGFKHEKEYELAAIDFFNNGDGEVYYGAKRNDYIRYNMSTGEYVVVNQEGMVKTYYHIPRKAFMKIIKQEECEKL